MSHQCLRADRQTRIKLIAIGQHGFVALFPGGDQPFQLFGHRQRIVGSFDVFHQRVQQPFVIGACTWTQDRFGGLHQHRRRQTTGFRIELRRRAGQKLPLDIAVARGIRADGRPKRLHDHFRQKIGRWIIREIITFVAQGGLRIFLMGDHFLLQDGNRRLNGFCRRRRGFGVGFGGGRLRGIGLGGGGFGHVHLARVGGGSGTGHRQSTHQRPHHRTLVCSDLFKVHRLGSHKK